MKRGIYAALIGIVLYGLWWALHRRDVSIDRSVASTTLGPDEKSKTILDAKHHTVTRVDITGVHRTFLNSHGPVAIIEKKNGRTSLVQRTWGTEHEAFAGGTLGSDFKFRVALGVNLFYIQRWEMGGGLLLQPGDVRDIRAFAHVGYNVYGNWLVSAAIDHKQTVHILASLRF